MIRKPIYLFFVICVTSGFLTVLGSMLGNALGKTGLFVGAIVGGLIGIAIAGLIAHRFGIIDHESYVPTTNRWNDRLSYCRGDCG